MQMKRLTCGAVVEGCTAAFEAETEREIMEQVVAHARQDHGMAEISPEFEKQVRARIEDA